MSSHQPIFPIFVGSGRSGTTLVQAIFSAHPDLAITHESQFIPRLADRQYMREGMFASEMFVRDLNRNPDYRRLEVDDGALLRSLAERPASDYSDAVRRVFMLYAEARGKTRYGDKSPGYVLHMERLAKLFPEARFVHVIRDGRAVALSYVETRFGPKDVPAGALYWQRRVTAGRASGHELGSDRYQELKYENVIADPEAAVRDVCPFLGLEFEPAMLRYFEQGEKLRSETADPGAHQSLALPPTRGLRNWREEMSDSDAAIFEALAGSTLTDFGYETSGKNPSPVTVLRAGRAWVHWQAQRAAARRKSLRRKRTQSSSN